MQEQKPVLPRHLAVIMDGNGRWAKARGLERTAGHRAGADAVRTLVRECRALGIGHLTLYAFSSENWSRPKAEISSLFSLLLEFLKREVPELEAQGIALRVIGDLEGLPLAQRMALGRAMERTAKGCAMILNLALNYGARAEILRAAKSLLKEGFAPEKLDEAAFAERLYTAGQPDPDFLIRTSGEMRLSNYLLWQLAYAEFYFTNKLWPDFGAEDLKLALADYAARSRRFGNTEAKAHGS